MITAQVFHKVGAEVGSSLPSFTSVGCYPLIYITSQGNVMCAKCAQVTKDKVTDADVFWEGDSYYCDNCSCELESAYGPTGE